MSSSTTSSDFYMGVDVGTASVRAVLLQRPAAAGKRSIVASATEALLIHRPMAEMFEQSSANIWEAVCKAVKKLLLTHAVKAECIRSIGFDATCSLVVLGRMGQPLSVSPPNALRHPHCVTDVIMWQDHRAKSQAERINKTQHGCLKYVGDTISLEMEPPKLLWLKENLPETFASAAHFMDLADFLTMKATGKCTRSLCCVVCKWLYVADEKVQKWDESFWKTIGLFELAENGFQRIGGTDIKPSGSLCGHLDPQAAMELGLHTNVVVATGIIDAHAGVLGTLGVKIASSSAAPNDMVTKLRSSKMSERLAIIAGTSTCHMALSLKPVHVRGVWGPYFSAVLPGFWLNEGGQSSVGPILDYIVELYGASTPSIQACENVEEKHRWIQRALVEYEQTHGALALQLLTKDVHVQADYHGNRSPWADPNLRGAIIGLQLPADVEPTLHLLKMYLAHVQSFAYGTKAIVDELLRSGHIFSAIYVCGGLAKNAIYVQCHADVCQLPVVLPPDDWLEPVACGAAILGAAASGDFSSLEVAAQQLAPSDGRVVLCNQTTSDYHRWKYEMFSKLGELQKAAKEAGKSFAL